MMVVHVVPGLNEPNNGIAVAAKLIAQEQSKSRHEVEVVETRDFNAHSFGAKLQLADEVWVHSMWMPQTLLACWKVIRAEKALVRMTHANLDPVRLGYHGWKKRLVGPVERWLLRRTNRVVVTCADEAEWVRAYLPEARIQVLDLKRFFRLGESDGSVRENGSPLHVLYLGRRHPLKGVEFLERAVRELKDRSLSNLQLELRCVSDHFGEELEKDWAWCDVLCLPTLSENFGLVVAEALERGKKVITTDGAPVWGEESKSGAGVERWRNRLVYLKGFRDGTDEDRVRLLKGALETFP